MFVFTEGAKWGEELFRFLYGEEGKTEIYDQFEIDREFISFDVQVDEQVYEDGIVIIGEDENKDNVLNRIEADIPVVLRIFHTEISLSDLERLGETSEIIFGGDEILDVEILVNNKVIGYGELQINGDEYILKIKRLKG